MKNLFDFATKELSQDAFLRWLFDSWEDPDVKDLIIDLLHNFGVDISYDDIVKLYTFPQICKIDVTIVIETKEKVHLVFIEDKTESNAHNSQLLIYDSKIFGGPLENEKHDFKALEEINARCGKILYLPDNTLHNVKFYNFDVHRIFYKTSNITDEDKVYLKESITLPNTFSARREAGKEGWEVFNIQDICNILKPYKDSNNVLLSMYITHTLKVNEKLAVTDMPTTKDIGEWHVYFNNVIKPYFESKGYLTRVWLWNGKESGIGIKCKAKDSVKDDYDNIKNEFVHVAFYNKCAGSSKGRIKFVITLEKEDVLKNQAKMDQLKQEIKRINDAFGTSKYPLVIKDSYMKPESKTLAIANLPIDTTENLIHSLEMAAKQLAYIDHSLKILE